MYKLALIVLSSLSFCQEVPEFLNDSFPKHEYHESSNVSNPALKTVEPQNTQMNQKVENAPTPSPIENSKNTQLKDISSEDRYAPQKLWAQAITEYALSFDYINHKQHFYLMRPFFDQNGWHELSALIREKFADIDAKKQISKVYEQNNSKKIGHYIPGTRIPIGNDNDLKKINSKTKAVFITHVQGFNGLSHNLLNVLKKKKLSY